MFKFIQITCCICMDDVPQCEELMSLPCSHTYHAACLQSNAAIQNLPIGTAACPQCKQVPLELVAKLEPLEEELYQESTAPTAAAAPGAAAPGAAAPVQVPRCGHYDCEYDTPLMQRCRWCVRQICPWHGEEILGRGDILGWQCKGDAGERCWILYEQWYHTV